MKLFHCTECNDVVTLSLDLRKCYCKQSSGFYFADRIRVQVFGPCEVLGILNSFVFNRNIDRAEVFRIREPHHKIERG